MISCAWLFIAFLLTWLSHESNAQGNFGTTVTQSDRELLYTLPASISNWEEYSVANNIEGWNSSSPVCTWTGITCSDTGRVVSLSLQCIGCPLRAQGTLPDELSLLSSITTVDLTGQNFTRGIPSSWFKTDSWPELKNLFLTNNPLGGVLPESQPGAMPVLIQLDLSNCNLAGRLPKSWGRDETSMRQTQILRLSNNNINGTLPQDWGTPGAFPKLKTLDLRQNSISGHLPDLWSNPLAAQYLQELFLDHNNLTGGLPSGIGNTHSLPALRYLNLANNPLGGEFPVSWSQNNSFVQLRLLDLNHTGLSGPLQPGLPYAFPVLQALRMAYNNLSGPIPSTFANFSNLQRLVIKPGNPYLCGPIPNNLPFQLCNDLDLSCLKVPVVLRPVCPPSLEPVPEYAGYHGGGDPGVGPGPGSSANAGAAPLQNGGGNVAGAASTIPAAIGVPPSQDPNTANYDGHGSADIGAIVGGVVGGVLGLLLVIGITLAIVLMVVDRRQRRRRQLQNFDDKSSRPSLLPFFSHEELQRSSLQQAPQPVHRTYDAPALVPATLSPQESHPLLSTLLSSMRLSHSNSSRTGKYSSGIQEVELSEPYAKAIMPPVLNDLSIDPNEIDVAKRSDGSDWIIGAGGFGRVYKAFRNGVQPVAVKVIPTKKDGSSDDRNAVRQEVAILRACRDPNIVQFQGAFLGENQTLLVTEYMEGGNLMDNLARGRVTWWRRGRRIAIDIAKGLVFLHSRRIVHFDLKSPNILLTRDGTAKIADVGMAKFLAQNYVTGIVSTLAWSAPEMLWGERCTEKADIYSYGIILWEICTGEPPERGRLRDVLVPGECPATVRDLMLDCLDTRPSFRPSAVQIVEILNKTATHKTQGPLPAKIVAEDGLAEESISVDPSQDPDFETPQRGHKIQSGGLNDEVSPFAAFAAQNDIHT